MLKNAKGEWVTDRATVQDLILEFYGNIFQTDHSRSNDISWEEPRNLTDLLIRISIVKLKACNKDSPAMRFRRQ